MADMVRLALPRFSGGRRTVPTIRAMINLLPPEAMSLSAFLRYGRRARLAAAQHRRYIAGTFFPPRRVETR
jgi:hypothetical protein